MNTIVDIPVDKLTPSKLQHRILRDKVQDAELLESIRNKGCQARLLVRQGNEIVDGHRRYDAAKILKLKSLPCEVREMTDEEAEEFILIAGIQRENLHPLDEGEAYRKLRARLTLKQIADKVGKPIRDIAWRLSLTNLIPELVKALKTDKLPLWAAQQLAREQAEIQQLVIKGGLFKYSHAFDENWIKGTLKDFHNDLSKVPWKLDDAVLSKAAGACTVCPKRTDNASELFPDFAKNICLDGVCFSQKFEIIVDIAMEKLLNEGHKPHYLSQQSSTGYYSDPIPAHFKPGLLYSDQFRIPDQNYEAITEGYGVFIDGPRLGKPVKIATKWKDKRAGRVDGAQRLDKWQIKQLAERKAQAFRQKVHNEVSNKVVTELLTKLPTHYTRAHWEIIIRRLVEDMGFDIQRRLGDALTVKPIGKGFRRDYENPILKQLLDPKLYRPERVVLALTGSSDLLYGYRGTLTHLQPLAKMAGVNITKVTNEVKRKLAEKKKSKAIARTKKAAKKKAA